LFGERVPERGQVYGRLENAVGIWFSQKTGLNANALLKVIEEGVKAGL
jgi:hypothetical protein